jgi:hypothetical protein
VCPGDSVRRGHLLAPANDKIEVRQTTVDASAVTLLLTPRLVWQFHPPAVHGRPAGGLLRRVVGLRGGPRRGPGCRVGVSPRPARALLPGNLAQPFDSLPGGLRSQRSHALHYPIILPSCLWCCRVGQAWGLYNWQEVDWSQLLPQLPRFVGMLLVVAFSSSLDVAAIEMELGERAWRGRERGRGRLSCGVPTPSPLSLTPLPVWFHAPLAPFSTQACRWITTESCRRSGGPTL